MNVLKQREPLLAAMIVLLVVAVGLRAPAFLSAGSLANVVTDSTLLMMLALTQMLGVGTTTVVSHAAGRKDHDRALLMFNQSQVLAMVTGVLFLIIGMAGRLRYASALSAF